MNFTSIHYLKTGNSVQKKAFNVLTALNIFEDFKEYQPLLVGTIPLEIQTLKSDLDIILYTNQITDLAKKLELYFKSEKEFTIRVIDLEQHILVCDFWFEGFEIEIYSQNKPTQQQMGYLHMLKEYEILQANSNAFKKQIIALKQQGIKTEPAFAQLLNLEGNPYEALLNYEIKKEHY